MNSSINKKIIVETSASTFSYDIENRGDIVYSGKAYKAPGNYHIEIDISKKIKDFLGSRMSSAWTETDGVYVCSGAMETFTVLNAEDRSVIDTFTVLNDWSGNWIGQTETLSLPINGRVDPRMKIFWNRASLSAGTEDIITGYDDIQFGIISGSLDFDFEQETHTLTVSAITDDYTVSSDDSWISVVKSGDTIQVSVTQNTGETRTGSFCVNWYDTHFNPVSECFEITQVIPFNMSIVGDLRFGYPASSGTFNYTATETPSVASYPEWVSGVTVNGTTAGTITVAVEENTGAQHSGSIVFSGQYGTKGFPIVQAEEYSGLTFEILTGGTVGIRNDSYLNITISTRTKTSWVNHNINSGSSFTINVNAGDIVNWKGANGSYWGTRFFGTAKFNVRGNISSLFTGKEMATNGCRELFRGTGVVDASKLVLFTELKGGCYSGMFNGCTSLTKAPELPATTLKTSCYSGMFYGCTSLETAPVLNASTVAMYSYVSMFTNCTSLNYVKCLASSGITPEGGAIQNTDNWLAGVSPTGTFVKKAGVSWMRGPGIGGVPDGWTIKNA